MRVCRVPRVYGTVGPSNARTHVPCRESIADPCRCPVRGGRRKTCGVRTSCMCSRLPKKAVQVCPPLPPSKCSLPRPPLFPAKGGLD